MGEGYISVSVTSRKKVTHEERKACLDKLYGNASKGVYGVIRNFNRAYGYADWEDDMVKEYPSLVPAKFKCPDDFETPETKLWDHIWVDLSSTGVFRFVVKNGIEQSKKRPSLKYDIEDMCRKLAAFLQDNYKGYMVQVKTLHSFNPILRTKILNFFYINMDPNSTYVTVELSAPRLLTDEEKAKIEKELKKMVPYRFHINQFYCETCKGYHPNCPYHTEIEYDESYCK